MSPKYVLNKYEKLKKVEVGVSCSREEMCKFDSCTMQVGGVPHFLMLCHNALKFIKLKVQKCKFII